MNGGLSILGQKCGENKGAFIQKMDQKWDFYLRMIQRINRDFVKSGTYKGTVYLLYSKAPKIATLILTVLNAAHSCIQPFISILQGKPWHGSTLDLPLWLFNKAMEAMAHRNR
jgi:hypothetical protein